MTTNAVPREASASATEARTPPWTTPRWLRIASDTGTRPRTTPSPSTSWETTSSPYCASKQRSKGTAGSHPSGISVRHDESMTKAYSTSSDAQQPASGPPISPELADAGGGDEPALLHHAHLLGD